MLEKERRQARTYLLNIRDIQAKGTYRHKGRCIAVDDKDSVIESYLSCFMQADKLTQEIITSFSKKKYKWYITAAQIGISRSVYYDCIDQFVWCFLIELVKHKVIE